MRHGESIISDAGTGRWRACLTRLSLPIGVDIVIELVSLSFFFLSTGPLVGLGRSLLSSVGGNHGCGICFFVFAPLITAIYLFIRMSLFSTLSVISWPRIENWIRLGTLLRVSFWLDRRLQLLSFTGPQGVQLQFTLTVEKYPFNSPTHQLTRELCVAFE